MQQLTELNRALFTVRDRDRILQFDGELLGHSSSRNGDVSRWVEFSIYRTHGHEYVLSRTGYSLIYHGLECDQMQRNSIPPIALPAPDAVPCASCRPDENSQQPFRPETPRYFARVYTSPEPMIADLYRQGDDGKRYLTRVARTVLETASRADPKLRVSA